jgi:hypothetical protein
MQITRGGQFGLVIRISLSSSAWALPFVTSTLTPAFSDDEPETKKV